MMKINTTFFKQLSLALACTALLSSCGKDNNGVTTPVEPTYTGKYLLLTAESGQGAAGYFATYDKMPTGDVDNISGYSLQARSYGGFRQYKNWVFNRARLDGTTGVVRYSVGTSGRIEETGFIKCGTSAQNLVVNETTGFYFDADRGKTKVQKFNPTTMQRTGEIDLSSIVEKGANISTNVFTGNQTLVAKEGKLFVNIDYARAGGGGHNDNTMNYKLAVVDIATDKIEKVITHPFLKNQGHSPSEYPALAQDSDGTIYMVSTGWDYNEQNVMVPQTSCIMRIKAGETDFDNTFNLKPADLGLNNGCQLWSVRAIRGKVYVDVSNTPINLPSMDNLWGNIYTVYAVDAKTKQATAIKNLPLTTFGHSSGNLELADNAVYVRVEDATNNQNGYYKINDDNTATKAFNVTRGGKVKGFVRFSGN